MRRTSRQYGCLGVQSEYKEYIFGVLFLKRCSDLFDHQREKLTTSLRARGLDGDRLEALLESREQYRPSIHSRA
jgi:type I restriction-modification system DNA methylase subunit